MATAAIMAAGIMATAALRCTDGQYNIVRLSFFCGTNSG